MTDSFRVRYTNAARDDLLRLSDFRLERAKTAGDFEVAERAIDAIRSAVQRLSESPFIYRKAAESPFLRELVIPFGSDGYVALYEIGAEHTVNVLAIRHQLEDDYH